MSRIAPRTTVRAKSPSPRRVVPERKMPEAKEAKEAKEVKSPRSPRSPRNLPAADAKRMKEDFNPMTQIGAQRVFKMIVGEEKRRLSKRAKLMLIALMRPFQTTVNDLKTIADIADYVVEAKASARESYDLWLPYGEAGALSVARFAVLKYTMQTVLEMAIENTKTRSGGKKNEIMTVAEIDVLKAGYDSELPEMKDEWKSLITGETAMPLGVTDLRLKLAAEYKIAPEPKAMTYAEYHEKRSRKKGAPARPLAQKSPRPRMSELKDEKKHEEYKKRLAELEDYMTANGALLPSVEITRSVKARFPALRIPPGFASILYQAMMDVVNNLMVRGPENVPAEFKAWTEKMAKKGYRFPALNEPYLIRAQLLTMGAIFSMLEHDKKEPLSLTNLLNVLDKM